MNMIVDMVLSWNACWHTIMIADVITLLAPCAFDATENVKWHEHLTLIVKSKVVASFTFSKFTKFSFYRKWNQA